ncbi:MAG: hypothetical protein WCN88_03030 [Candidatus Falkowbacteria bacterium]
MNLTLVMYRLEVGQNYFIKQIFVNFLPPDGSYLKISNYSFRVNEIEQDLDAYADKKNFMGLPCESVRANLNMMVHNPESFSEVEKDLRGIGWQKIHRR